MSPLRLACRIRMTSRGKPSPAAESVGLARPLLRERHATPREEEDGGCRCDGSRVERDNDRYPIVRFQTLREFLVKGEHRGTLEQ